jgi:hypothetical protein
MTQGSRKEDLSEQHWATGKHKLGAFFLHGYLACEFSLHASRDIRPWGRPDIFDNQKTATLNNGPLQRSLGLILQGRSY